MSSLFSVHADVLKMAKSKEKREAIKWFNARRVFFKRDLRADLELARGVGLELARESEHSDARYFASLSPAQRHKPKLTRTLFSWRKGTSRAPCAGLHDA